ncbi:MAG: c-type cytochrome [Magnetococcales bacterium]|nr:c-type cytochrome [Magnetococcales bacterium]
MNGRGLFVRILVVAIGFLSACSHGPEVGKGQRIAEEYCAPCHDLTASSSIRHGPPLWGIHQRPLGNIEQFNYSPSFQERRKEGDFVWSEMNLDRFLGDPRGLIPNNRMSAWDPGLHASPSSGEPGKSMDLVRASLASMGHYEPFRGFKNPSDRQDLIAYLKTLGAKGEDGRKEAPQPSK